MEYCGVEAAGQLYAAADPQQLSGKLVIVPVLNMQTFQFRTPLFNLAKSCTLSDGMDINAT
jgi:predicted deacylase